MNNYDTGDIVISLIFAGIALLFVLAAGFGLLSVIHNWNNPCFWYTKCIQITGDRKDVSLVTAIINKDDK